MKHFIVLTIMTFVFSGCKILPPAPSHTYDPVPNELKFSIFPDKESYLPFQNVMLELLFKNKGTFKKNLGFPYYKIDLTPLSAVNGQETHHVNWKAIHKNGIGGGNNIRGIRWFLNPNWCGIIPQKEGIYKIRLVFSTPNGYWQTDDFDIQIKIQDEERRPYNRFMELKANEFFKYDFSVRLNNRELLISARYPKERPPFESIVMFISEYPYSYITKAIIRHAKNTERWTKNLKLDYNKKDMEEIEKIIEFGT